MKASRAIVRQRVEQVMKIRLLGGMFNDVRDYANEDDPETGRPWQVCDRQLWRYVAASDGLLAKYLKSNEQKLLNRAIGQREALYSRAVESGDWRAALAIADSRDRLLGLFPKESGDSGGRTQINVWAPVLQGLSDEELSFMARLAERVGQVSGENGNGRNHQADEAGIATPGTGSPGAMPKIVPLVCGPHVDSV